jgi:flagellar biosynthesis protein FlhF
MQIKKYVAATLKEASAQMKEELGNEAIILSTRVFEEGTPSGRKKMFEIVAGLDSRMASEATAAEPVSNTKGKSFDAELKKLSEKIYNPVSGLPLATEPAHKSKKTVAENFLEKELKEIVDVLVYREVQKSIVTVILNQLKKYKSVLDTENLDSYVLSSIASLIPTTAFELKKRGSPKVVSLVGPTGVGKTTCIAKLAVISKILQNLDVGLISIDTYRLGAIDQLRTFSEISDIELLVAYEPDEMPELVKKLKKKDIIFIDTAGRSQKNLSNLEKTKEFLDAAGTHDSFLVLSATGSSKNLIDVAERFKLFNYNSIMFTKIDEAVSFGNILNISVATNVPITFLTNGQIIPDDIISADSDFLAKMILTGKVSQ